MWCIDLGRRLGKPHCYPVIAGGVYALGAGEGALMALDLGSGRITWEHPLDEGSATHALATDGERLFVGCQDMRAFPTPGKALLALDARTGGEIWRYPTTAHSLSAVTLAAGILYFTATDGLLHAVDAATGQGCWAIEHPTWGAAAPAIGEGVVCAGGQGQTLCAYAVADGTEMWRFSAQDAWFVVRPSVHGHVYVPSSEGRLYVLDTHTGRLLWKLESECGLGSTTPPAVVGDRVFIGSRVYRPVEGQRVPGYAMLAVDASNGAEEWRFYAAHHISTPPTVAGDTLFFGTDETFYAVDTTNGEERWRTQVRSWVVTQPQVAGDVVYFGERNGRVHAMYWRAGPRDERRKPGHSLQPRQEVLANSYALLIGINDYFQLRPLTKATADVRDLYDLLAQSGCPSTHLTLLANEQATKAAISDQLDCLARQTNSGDTVLIAFSGHGVQRVGGFEPGEYICPVEADWHNLRATAISDVELTTALRAIRAGRVAVFLDACHSGGVGEPKDAALQVKAGLSEAAYARLAEGRGRAVIASCRPDEVSWELADLRNGLFTHYLLEGLRGAAADPDGSVGILDLFKYVSRQVPQHKPQHPLFKGEIEVNFAITTGVKPPAMPAPPIPTSGEPTVPPPTEIAPGSVDPKKLRLAMHTAYDRPAFEVLCKDLGLDYHDLRGETLETKMLYLIDKHRRRRQYARLVRKVLEDHPYLAQELR